MKLNSLIGDLSVNSALKEVPAGCISTTAPQHSILLPVDSLGRPKSSHVLTSLGIVPWFLTTYANAQVLLLSWHQVNFNCEAIRSPCQTQSSMKVRDEQITTSFAPDIST